MNITSLKLLALISMLIDHMGIVFFYDVISFRIIGRISFPIYAFLISDGCKYSKNIYNYAIKLFLLAIISEIPSSPLTDRFFDQSRLAASLIIPSFSDYRSSKRS